jgi:hypothetical protein
MLEYTRLELEIILHKAQYFKKYKYIRNSKYIAAALQLLRTF